MITELIRKAVRDAVIAGFNDGLAVLGNTQQATGREASREGVAEAAVTDQRTIAEKSEKIRIVG